MEQQNIYNLSLGVAGGFATRNVARLFANVAASRYTQKRITGFIRNNAVYKDPLLAAYEKSGLKEAGILMLDTNNDNINEVLKTVESRCVKRPQKNIFISLMKKVPNKKISDKFKASMRAVAAGYNACYIGDASVILINQDKFPLVGFHEIGHAIGRQNNFIRKMIAKYKTPILTKLPPAILLIGLLWNKKEKSDSSENMLHKSLSFVKNNCGKLTSLCFVPLLAEEGIASLNAAKLAKDVLNKPMYKNMCKFNAFAWSTYLLSAVISGLVAASSVFVRDKIVEKNFVKKLMKTQSSAS